MKQMTICKTNNGYIVKVSDVEEMEFNASGVTIFHDMGQYDYNEKKLTGFIQEYFKDDEPNIAADPEPTGGTMI